MTIRQWPGRRWAAAVLGAGLTALAIGVPTGIIRTPFYHRMTPVQWWNYPVWAVTALLSGLILATYIRTAATPGRRQRATSVGGGVLSLFAVGLPGLQQDRRRSSGSYWRAESVGARPAAAGHPLAGAARLGAAQTAGRRAGLPGQGPGGLIRGRAGSRAPLPAGTGISARRQARLAHAGCPGGAGIPRRRSPHGRNARQAAARP